jgi:hypothetical protein
MTDKLILLFDKDAMLIESISITGIDESHMVNVTIKSSKGISNTRLGKFRVVSAEPFAMRD